MSKKRKHPTRRPNQGQARAQRTTPAHGGYLTVDDTRTYLVFGAFVESMISLGAGRAPLGVVRCDLTGKWNHGAEDEPVLVIDPKLAREWGEALIEGAAAAERDEKTYLRGVHPKTGAPL